VRCGSLAPESVCMPGEEREMPGLNFWCQIFLVPHTSFKITYQKLIILPRGRAKVVQLWLARFLELAILTDRY
jgi:hypothetical protein